MAEVPTVCEHLHLPLQSGSDRVLAAMHRGYTAERYLDEAGRRPRRGARPGGDHRHHRGLPRRDRRRLRAHPRGGGRRRVRQRLHVHLLAPAGHRGGRAGRRLRRSRRRGRALRAPAGRHRALGARPSTGPGRPHRGGRRRGPDPPGPDADQRPHPPEQARPLRLGRHAATGHGGRGRGHRRRRPPPPGRPASRSPPRPATAPASRWSRAERAHRSGARSVALATDRRLRRAG